MSSIFSHAVNALKTSRSVPEKDQTWSKTKRDNTDIDTKTSGSVLERIKLNKGTKKTIKTITLRKGLNDSDDEHPFEIKSVQKKIITKDISNLKKPQTKSSSEGVWKHDLYEGPPVNNTSNMHCKIFIRNLPEMVSSQHLRSLLTNDDDVVGIRVF